MRLRLLLPLFLLLPQAALAEGERVALVIGNAAYAPAIALANPVNDAEGVAQKLGGLGFKVFKVTDGDLATMKRALQGFSAEAKGAEAALVYYSGHGAQVAGANYLVPVDFVIGSNADLATETLPMEEVLGALAETQAEAKLLFFDACRDNPLRTRGLSRPAESQGVTGAASGLGTVKARVPGTFMAFATTPGEVALDGTGPHSPFTAAILEHIGEPGAELSEFMRDVRASVIAATRGAQTPWDETSMTAAFYFAEPGAAPEPEARREETRPEPAIVEIEPEAPQQVAGADVIFPNSSEELIAEEDVRGLSPATLRIARNEIFARKGRFFSDPSLDAYFRQFSWYRPLTWDVTLSALEKRNVELFRRHELGGAATPVVFTPPDADAGGTEAGAGDFLIPHSATRRLTEADVAGLSPAELRIARNEIFARRGRIFRSRDLDRHFRRFAWYEPRAAEVRLSKVERANVDFLARLEKGGGGGSGSGGGGATAGGEGFIFPDSHTRRLSPSDIAGLSAAELRLARNEIYARRGRIFKSADLKRHFARFSWYRPVAADVRLNAVEKANVDLLQAAEQ